MYDSRVEWDTNINTNGGLKDVMLVNSPYSNVPSANATQGTLTYGNLVTEFEPPKVIIHPQDDGYYVRNRFDMNTKNVGYVGIGNVSDAEFSSTFQAAVPRPEKGKEITQKIFVPDLPRPGAINIPNQEVARSNASNLPKPDVPPEVAAKKEEVAATPTEAAAVEVAKEVVDAAAEKQAENKEEAPAAPENPTGISNNTETYIAPSRRTEKMYAQSRVHEPFEEYGDYEAYTEIPGLRDSEVHVTEPFTLFGQSLDVFMSIILYIIYFHLFMVCIKIYFRRNNGRGMVKNGLDALMLKESDSVTDYFNLHKGSMTQQ